MSQSQTGETEKIHEGQECPAQQLWSCEPHFRPVRENGRW